MARLSTTNLVATATLTSSTEHATYTDANLASPQRPFLPWRSTAITESWVKADFTTAQQLDLVAIVAANVGTVRVEANSTDAWTAPPYSQTVYVSPNPWTGRYQRVVSPGVAYRYLRILIPAQTPVDGAAYFSLGGLWAGAALTLPALWRIGLRHTAILPQELVGPAHRGWSQRLRRGEPRVKITGELPARAGAASPGDGDSLEAWLIAQRLLWAADYGFLDLGVDDPSQGYVVRPTGDMDWTLDGAYAGGTWDVEEVVGP